MPGTCSAHRSGSFLLSRSAAGSSYTDAVNQYDDGRYRQHNADWHDQDASWKALQIVDLLSSVALQPASVCDVGCGTGGVLANLSRFLPHATMVGFEPSQDAVQLANELHPDVDVQSDPRVLDRHFELALVLDVFEHVEDYLGFLRRISSLASAYIFHIPLDMTAQMVLRSSPILSARQSVGHLHYFSRDTAIATLRDTGYVVDEMKYTRPDLAMSRRSWRSAVAWLPRRLAFRLAPDLAVRTLGGASLLVLAHTVGSGQTNDLRPARDRSS